MSLVECLGVCVLVSILYFCVVFKQKTAYEMRISDWSSDVCSSDLLPRPQPRVPKGLVGRLFDRRVGGSGRIGLRRGFARHLRDGGGELIGGIGRGEAGGRHQESAARQADVVAAGGRHDDRIGARRLDLAKHGGALDRKSTRLNSSHSCASRMPLSA